MLKKILAGIVCTAMAAVSLVSCGDNNKEGNGDTADTTAADTAVENVDIANFTAPEKGDTIIVMNVKDYGTIKLRLFPEYAEKGVENFVELAKKGYYDGLKFHRVINDFMIQGGDPDGIGTGGESIWGGKFDGGTDPHLIHAAGALAYANSGSTATNGSQFYIVTGTVPTDDEFAYYEAKGMKFSDNAKEIYKKAGGAPWLDGGYTVFGQVIEGLDVVFSIQTVRVDQGNSMPMQDVIMESVTVGEYDGSEIKWYISDYEDFEPVTAPIVSTKENTDIANFTAPQEGETIVSMKLKDYDGTIKIKLFPEYAEQGVENFIELAKRGYYDGLTFHRVIKDFMIQGGDPNGDGSGGESIYDKGFDGGTDPHLIHAAGAVAYANSGSTASNGSQFYIVTGEIYDQETIDELMAYGYDFSENEAEIYSTVGGTPWLDGNYTIFGQVFDGLDIVFQIQETATGEKDKPEKDIIIESVTVEEYAGEEVRWAITDYE